MVIVLTVQYRTGLHVLWSPHAPYDLYPSFRFAQLCVCVCVRVASVCIIIIVSEMLPSCTPVARVFCLLEFTRPVSVHVLSSVL